MVEITIGVASALIAVGIVSLQSILPNALALILTDGLTTSESAVTWSVVSRFLLSSHWPLLLNSDTTASSSVRSNIAVLTWLRPLGFLLIAVAAVVTPLGLYNSLEASRDSEALLFVYSADPSIVGAGTPARSPLGFSKVCYEDDRLCPGSTYIGNVTGTVIHINGSHPIRTPAIPTSLVDLFQSRLEDQMKFVFSFFDVQYRVSQEVTGDATVGNTTFLQDEYSRMLGITMRNDYMLLEGVIANTVTGGIGFRNHSYPTGLQIRAEWEEDTLFMEPDTVCINMNITIGYDGSPYKNRNYYGHLIDRGDFVNFNKTPPITADPYPFADGQSRSTLYDRAYYAAWGTNFLNMLFLNITDPGNKAARISSELGQRFQVNTTLTSGYQLPELMMSNELDQMTGPPLRMIYNSTLNDSIPNPHNVTKEDFSNHQYYCSGKPEDSLVSYSGSPGPDSSVSPRNVDVSFGIVAGPAYSASDTNSATLTVANITGERPLFVCAGQTRFLIKAVKFGFNTTSGKPLENLRILDIWDKAYGGDVKEPLWGVETPEPAWDWRLIDPI